MSRCLTSRVAPVISPVLVWASRRDTHSYPDVPAPDVLANPQEGPGGHRREKGLASDLIQVPIAFPRVRRVGTSHPYLAVSCGTVMRGVVGMILAAQTLSGSGRRGRS